MRLDDVKPQVSNSGPKTTGVPVLIILRIPITVNGALPLPSTLQDGAQSPATTWVPATGLVWNSWFPAFLT